MTTNYYKNKFVEINRKYLLILLDAYVRTNPRKRDRTLQGTLEAHINCFRFTCVQNKRIFEIMYSNIKKAFLQPAEDQTFALIHLLLHTPLAINEHEISDVQFFVTPKLLNANSLSSFSPNGSDDEQKEKKMAEKINIQLFEFTWRVQETIWDKIQTRDLNENLVEWEMTNRKLAFNGV